ncbi:nucleotidyltransferase family protein [Sphingomonas sp.]|uniref:nucleotidyltransferase domain-containing protein n=1 Tax=Sphingomonas sp. TaxID=28214 RepID=UPI003AFFACCD
MDAGLTLCRALADPASVAALDGPGWTTLLTVARAEQLLGTLAHRLTGLPVPDEVGPILADTRIWSEQQRRSALWEAEMARRALAPLGLPVVLLKGTAYAAAGLSAGQGRAIGDLDILVRRDDLAAAEAALLSQGWEWVKPDPYDDLYYRQWMHELPPLIHRDRDRMADVHHTILPPTAGPRPDANSLINDAIRLGNGLYVLAPADMIVHAAAHLFADGDLTGGLRNLWDIHCLLNDFGSESLEARAALHGLLGPVMRAARLATTLFGHQASDGLPRRSTADAVYLRRLLTRDGWGRPTRPMTRLAFYARSHLLRMPPPMLARHLWIKWRKGFQA